MAFDDEDLSRFIVEAKSKTYVGRGNTQASCRRGSHDIAFERGKWHYLDSYFGGTDFAGQEIVWFGNEAVWAMNYFGRILDPALIDAERAGAVITAALSTMYTTKHHFLGGMEYDHTYGRYVDRNDGDTPCFSGREIISVDGVMAYALNYHGGLIIP